MWMICLSYTSICTHLVVDFMHKVVGKNTVNAAEARLKTSLVYFKIFPLMNLNPFKVIKHIYKLTKVEYLLSCDPIDLRRW